MDLYKIKSETGTIFNSIEGMYEDLIDCDVNVDYHNTSQIVRLHKATFNGSYTKYILSEMKEEEILKLLKELDNNLNMERLKEVISFYEYIYDENESMSRNLKELSELIYRKEHVDEN